MAGPTCLMVNRWVDLSEFIAVIGLRPRYYRVRKKGGGAGGWVEEKETGMVFHSSGIH
jgi:hypothetical protein